MLHNLKSQQQTRGKRVKVLTDIQQLKEHPTASERSPPLPPAQAREGKSARGTRAEARHSTRDLVFFLLLLMMMF